MTVVVGYNKGIAPKRLFFKYRVDTWGHFLSKKKFRNHATRRMLTLFERNLRWSVMQVMRPFRFKLKRATPKKRPFIKFGVPLITKKKTPPKTHYAKSLFFNNLFKYYSVYKNYNKRQNFLLSAWQKGHVARMRHKIPSFLYYVNFKRMRARLSRPNIRRRSFIAERKLTILKYQQFFCLPSIEQTKRFLRKQELNYYRMTRDRSFFGMESNILNLIFRSNLFHTTRFGYILIKLGAVYVNNHPISSARVSLQLFDIFNFHPSFIKTIFYHFRRRLRRRQVPFGVPGYLSYNYKLMSFKIWRVPTLAERKFINTYPYWRKQLDTELDPITPDDFLDITLE